MKNLTLFLTILLYPTFSNGMTLEMCTKVATEIRKDLPVTVNKYTTMHSAACERGKKKPKLIYTYIADYEYMHINDSKSLLKNQVCRSLKQKKLLREVDLKYVY